MSKGVFKAVGTIAAGVALVAGTISTAGIGGAAFAATAGKVATYATLAATAAQIGARITAKPPPARGSITQTIIAAEPPRPYPMGETYSAGVLRHRVGYGAERKKVPNPYLLDIRVFSGVGPIQSMGTPYFDFETIGSYYTDYYAIDTQLGEVPEATALVPQLSAPATGWTSASKLSGCAADALNLLFDKDGRRFARGIPVYGRVIQGVKVYDPRLDDTQPGGVGPHRLGDETTYTYSDNPALHAGMYVYGRYVGTTLVMGVGTDADGIDWAAVAAWANDCDTNGWTISGTVYEGGDQDGPGVRAANLDDICAAGAGRWFTSGALVTFDWQRPRVSLATFTDKDIVDEGFDFVALQSRRDRMNGVRPQYRSAAHNWELITADEIIGSTYRTEDGKPNTQTWALNLVKDTTQAGQIGTYAMADSREIGPINIPLGIEWDFYRVGDCLTFDSEILNDTLKLVVIERTPDPVTLQTNFVFKTETDAKHAFALGETAIAPPTPVIGQTGEERDAVAAYMADPRGAFRIRAYVPAYPVSSDDSSVSVTAFDATLEDGQTISLPPATLSGLASGSFFALFWDLLGSDYVIVAAPGTAQLESSRYVYIGSPSTSTTGTYPGGPIPPPGWSSDPNQQ